MLESLILKDICTGATVEMTVSANETGIEMSFDGYGDHGSANGHGTPVFIELRDGHLTVHVWADINRSDPTHSISLEYAREKLRQPKA